MAGIADLTDSGWLAKALIGPYVTVGASGQIDPSLIPPTGEAVMVWQQDQPTASTTVTIAANTRTQVIKPAGLLAALTIKLPASPIDARSVEIVFTQAITLLTIDGNGATVSGAASGVALGGFMKYRYRTTDNTWYRVG
ncbi:hypothetical protein GIY62_06440 [Burkholderia plantarii]|uniref:hypothetical protein n=1 Tax=Burkholderia plantarii TaxID=41899 RepID=UPI00272A7A52|nr:hypothetical protein [Burkholderia plantarii]WLE60290.1 hypothetical protein GIY62_06440 [Burkholderia plantarii]